MQDASVCKQVMNAPDLFVELPRLQLIRRHGRLAGHLNCLNPQPHVLGRPGLENEQAVLGNDLKAAALPGNRAATRSWIRTATAGG